MSRQNAKEIAHSFFGHGGARLSEFVDSAGKPFFEAFDKNANKRISISESPNGPLIKVLSRPAATPAPVTRTVKAAFDPGAVDWCMRLLESALADGDTSGLESELAQFSATSVAARSVAMWALMIAGGPDGHDRSTSYSSAIGSYASRRWAEGDIRVNALSAATVVATFSEEAWDLISDVSPAALARCAMLAYATMCVEDRTQPDKRALALSVAAKSSTWFAGAKYADVANRDLADSISGRRRRL